MPRHVMLAPAYADSYSISALSNLTTAAVREERRARNQTTDEARIVARMVARRNIPQALR